MSGFYPWREAPEAEFGVIGDPVAHSLSPLMHTAAYRALGLPYRYVSIQVPTGEVSAALNRLRSLGYQGINVTVPHKEEVLGWASQVEMLARRVRAANTLRLADSSCINTDAPGFTDTLAAFDPPQRTALLLGAGGSARAVAVALLTIGYKLFLYNRTRAKAEALADEFKIPAYQIRDTADPAGVSLLINTTSASLNKDKLPVQWNRAEKGALAYDLMYAKEPTLFLQAAAQRGLATIDGRAMLVAQGARSFKWWLGIDPPRDVMLEAIR